VLTGQENYISASIGIAIAPVDGNDSEELLKKADTAMYRAKTIGRGRFVYFEEQMNVETTEHMNLEREIRQGLLRKEFTLHYQPKIDLRTGHIAGAEALVRWNHPTRGLVYPDVFIGVAEDTGLIEEIGRNVIWDACTQHAAWRAAGVHAPSIAVNVSGRQFRRGDLFQIINEALQTTSTPPGALEIEVTESLFMDEACDATAVLNELRQMGLRVTIDDFGTGYSSLNYLQQLPLDALKIDVSFIRNVVKDLDDAVIVKTIIAMAHNLNLKVIAEGVEDEQQFEFLEENGCDIIQGYLFSPPVPAERFFELLTQWNDHPVLHR